MIKAGISCFLEVVLWSRQK